MFFITAALDFLFLYIVFTFVFRYNYGGGDLMKKIKSGLINMKERYKKP